MVYKFKYLDIQMDSTLSWKDLISKLGKMVSSRIGMLRSSCITRNNVMILPLFDYFSCVWNSCGKLCKDYLDRLNRCAAYIIECRSVNYNKLHKHLVGQVCKWMFTFKSNNGLAPG